jgi:hypothetical protein
MKWKIRFIIYSLLAGTIVSINSCKDQEITVQLLTSKVLPHFPSASAIEFHDNKFYVFGDDASYLLVLDTNYLMVDSISFFKDTAFRISKDAKPDIEASTLLNFGDQTYLYGFGSMSKENRKLVYAFPLDSLKGFIKTNYSTGTSNKIKEWNIEGAAFVNDQLLFVNRANQTNKDNYIIVETFISNKPKDSVLKILKIDLPQNQLVAGVSGLHYIPETDLLLFTASEENTPNAYEDGAIGNSYLGFIKNFSKKMFRNSVKPDGFINLSASNSAFKNQKIESVCLQSIIDNKLMLHLVSDNDNGQSRIFKLQVAL